MSTLPARRIETLVEPLSVRREPRRVVLEVPDAPIEVRGSRSTARALRNAPDTREPHARVELYPGHGMDLKQLVPANWAPLQIAHAGEDRTVLCATHAKNGPLRARRKTVSLYVKPTPKTFHIDGEPVGPANRFAKWEARIAHYLHAKGIPIARAVGHYERPNGEHYSIFTGVPKGEPLIQWTREQRQEDLEALREKIQRLGVNPNDLEQNGNVQWTAKGPVIVDCNRFTLRPSHPDYREFLRDAGAVGLPIRQPRTPKGRH